MKMITKCKKCKCEIVLCCGGKLFHMIVNDDTGKVYFMCNDCYVKEMEAKAKKAETKKIRGGNNNGQRYEYYNFGWKINEGP